jgi:DNA-binding transcriptional ArsR family regulator
MSPKDGRFRPIEPRALAEMRAMAHPVRLRILSLLVGAPMTAADVSRELGLTHANASYHLRHLLAAGTIEIAGEERIRGAVARRYRYDMDRDLRLSGKPATDSVHMRQRRQLYVAVADELKRRAQRVRPRARRGHLTDAELWVDPQVWQELKSTVDEVSEKLHQAARPPRAPGAILVSATLVMFEMQPPNAGRSRLT